MIEDDVAPVDLEARALWHAELVAAQDWKSGADLGEPGDDSDDGWDEGDGLDCTRCGGEGYAQVDDPLWDECDEFGYGPCNACHGTGDRRHQWVF